MRNYRLRGVTAAALTALAVCLVNPTASAAGPAQGSAPDDWTPPVIFEPERSNSLGNLAGGPDDQAAVAWTSDGRVLVARRLPGGGWESDTLFDSDKGRDVRIQYDGQGMLHAVWAVVQDAGNGDGPSRLETATWSPGVGWSPASIIASKQIGVFRGLDLEVNRGGDAVLVWEWISHEFARIMIMSRSDEGWSPPVRLTRGFEGTGYDAAIGPTGDAVVALASCEEKAQTSTRVVVRRRPPGGSWSRPQVLSQAGGADDCRFTGNWTPGLSSALTSDGVAHVLWAEPGPDGRWRPWTSSARRGVRWSRPRSLTRSGAGISILSLAVGGRGGRSATAVWGRLDGRVDAARFGPRGGWAQPVRLAGPAPTAVSDLVLGTTWGPTAVVAWTRTNSRDHAGDSWVVHRGAGPWTRPLRISPKKALSLSAAVTARPGEDALVAWVKRQGQLVAPLFVRTSDSAPG